MSGILLGVIASLGGAARGCQTYTVAGTYSWVAPAGVTKVSVVAVGAGSGGGWYAGGAGGGLGYRNNIAVTPGTSYSLQVGTGGVGSASQPAKAGSASYFGPSTNPRGDGGGSQFPTPQGGTYVGDGGGNGGNGGGGSGSGGAGGYSGNGGSPGVAGSGGGGGGGGAGGQYFCSPNSFVNSSAGGGGVGLLGQGSNGAGGTAGVHCTTLAGGGGGGSGGASGNQPTALNGNGGAGGAHGGGGGAGGYCYYCCCYQRFGSGGNGGGGAVRIVWPGCSRSFPSTDVA